MNAIQLQINRLPLQLTCVSNGCIVIDRLANFHTIIDQPETGVHAIISNEDIYIGADTVINYGEMYNPTEYPELKAWLAAQGMELPQF